MRFRASTLVKSACAILAIGALAWGITAWAESINAAPSCTWPLRVHGRATSEQTGLARCYLQALATRDQAELKAVAANMPPPRITGADFRYTPDARAGVASAEFTPSPVDTTFVILTIKFADGVVDKTGMLNMIAMGGSSTWRMAVGGPAFDP